MKVLFATYPMAFHTPGGGEIQLLAYKKYLPAHGVGVSLLDPWNPRILDYDIVHFFSCIGGSSHFCRFIKQLGLPLVVSSSLWITEETRHLYPIDEIRVQLDLADCVVANSNIECDNLARVLDLPREKFVTVYNGVDPIFMEHISPDLFRQNFKISERFVLNVGNIEPRKNQLQLVHAMKALPDMKLVLIGHARDPAYANEVLGLGGDQVRYIGALAHESELLRSAYAACEVFCLPSTLETPGLAALEAHATNCRIAITQEGSTYEYFGESVTYHQPSNIDSIVNSITTAITPNASQTFKNNNMFLWQPLLRQLKLAYENVLTK